MNTDKNADCILVVEDDSAIRQLLQLTLEREGFIVLQACDTTEADQHIDSTLPALILLDWMMPRESGISYLNRLRQDHLTRNISVILLTAKAAEADVITGLDAGADDYVTKPFSPRELLSRIKALLRRGKDFEQTITLNAGQLSLIPDSHQVQYNGKNLPIKGKEFKLLKCLIESPDRVFSRSQLLDLVWGRSTYLEERTVDVHVLRLRKLLKPCGADHMIETIRGAGYRLSNKSLSQ